jgi:hypothetical protein
MRALIPVLRSDLTPCDSLYPGYAFIALINPAEKGFAGIFYEFRGLDYQSGINTI